MKWTSIAAAVGGGSGIVALFIGMIWLMDLGIAHGERNRKNTEIDTWNAACQDESRLLATTTGSPSGYRCSNKAHRMRVQVATNPSNEEAAALVFCECQR